MFIVMKIRMLISLFYHLMSSLFRKRLPKKLLLREICRLRHFAKHRVISGFRKLGLYRNFQWYAWEKTAQRISEIA